MFKDKINSTKVIHYHNSELVTCQVSQGLSISSKNLPDAQRIYHPVVKKASESEWLRNSPNQEIEDKRKLFHNYLCVNHDVNIYRLRPFDIHFKDKKGFDRTYKPFLSIRYRYGLMEIADVLTDSYIRENSDWFIAVWKIMNQYAISNGQIFRIYRDKFFESDYFYNVQFIKGFYLDEPNEEYRDLIKFILDAHGVTKISTVLRIGSHTEKQRRKLIRTIWTLVGMGCVQTDWNKKFDHDTEIFILE